MTRLGILVALMAVLVAACGGSDFPKATTFGGEAREFGWEECEAPVLDDHRVLSNLERRSWEGEPLRLEPVVELDDAIEAAVHPLDGTLYVTTQDGLLYRVDEDGGPSVALDLRRRVLVGEEQGLLGVVFHPDGGSAYLSFTDTDGAVTIEEYAYPAWTGRREVLVLKQPGRWHNGGHMAFGPDTMLYLGLGDGGKIGDPDGLGQDRNELFGSIVRIDPSEGETYEVPSDNPFPDGRSEIVAYGLRNPWQFSFDRATGDLWLGDVGQNCWEEIDRMPAGEFGQNFGWSHMEGPMRFRNDVPADYVPPVLSYFHDAGCAVTGGIVYRGEAIPSLAGHYVFADYCLGRLLAFPSDGVPSTLLDLGVSQGLLVSFAEDADGELLVVSKTQGVFRLGAG